MKILYFSTVNWKWIKQRPHFICEHLSKNQIDVTYFSITPFLKQKIFHKRLSEHLYIKDKFTLPYSSKITIIKKINILYIKRILNENYDIVILTHPEQYDYLPNHLKYTAKIVYECMDNIPYFYDKDRRVLVKKREKQLCEKASKIITSSTYLKNKIIIEYLICEEKIDVIKNALEYSLISTHKKSINLKSPNLIYIGTISEWLDIDTIKRYAKDNPEYTIYLVGPVEKHIKKKVINKSNNIIFLGAIEHENVKEYIKAGDIMLIPFKVSKLINGVDPVKLYEYLAFNKPVVTTYWSELEPYKSNELVYFYNNYEEFVLAINKIKNRNIIENEMNIKFIEQNTWENRVKSYIKVLKNYVNRGKEEL